MITIDTSVVKDVNSDEFDEVKEKVEEADRALEQERRAKERALQLKQEAGREAARQFQLKQEAVQLKQEADRRAERQFQLVKEANQRAERQRKLHREAQREAQRRKQRLQYSRHPLTTTLGCVFVPGFLQHVQRVHAG